MLNGLDLFTGIGGMSIALSDWVRPIAYCEIDPYCQAVLLSRMATGDLWNAPIWDNISTFRLENNSIPIDIIFGGFPCQDISVAGLGKGLDGERSGLFFEIMRLAKEIQPKFIFLENVPAITSRGGLRVVREITEMGYDCRWCVISAASIGALHRRERWFLLAHSHDYGTPTSQDRKAFRERFDSRGIEQHPQSVGSPERASKLFSDVADSNGTRLERMCGEEQKVQKPSRCSKIIGYSNSIPGQQTDSEAEPIPTEQRTWRRSTRQHWPFESREHWQETVSTMGKCSDGIPNHMARLRALGNAVVTIQAKEAFQILMGLKI